MSDTGKAAALKYNEALPAPFILAKGKGRTARKILDLAKEFEIPVAKEEVLAESLFLLDIGDLIPEDLYELVAIILSYVYEIQGRI